MWMPFNQNTMVNWVNMSQTSCLITRYLPIGNFRFDVLVDCVTIIMFTPVLLDLSVIGCHRSRRGTCSQPDSVVSRRYLEVRHLIAFRWGQFVPTSDQRARRHRCLVQIRLLLSLLIETCVFLTAMLSSRMFEIIPSFKLVTLCYCICPSCLTQHSGRWRSLEQFPWPLNHESNQGDVLPLHW
jgi:hypothetical protein